MRAKHGGLLMPRHVWFAWYPVVTRTFRETGHELRTAWLRKVIRREVVRELNGLFDGFEWQYEEINRRDVHQERADREGISRDEAKRRNFMEWYSGGGSRTCGRVS